MSIHVVENVGSGTRLKANAISPWGLAALAIGITSPAMGLYALWGPMEVAAGPVTPLIFLAAMLMTMPTAISYALLNRVAPSAGAASTWLWSAIGPMAGYLAGLLMTTYFFMAAVAQPLMFALFFQDLLIWLHVRLSPAWVLGSGVIIATIPVAWVCLRGAEASIKTTVRLMLIETAVVLSLSATILIVKGHTPGAINISPFNPHNVTSLSGFWQAMILGVLGYCGFDVVSTAAEEAHAPAEHVPKAILYTVIGIALFWAVNSWAFTLSTPPETVRAYTSNGLTAVTPLAQNYWGWGNLAVILTAFTGLLAVYISSVQGASRIVFAMARHGLLPRRLSLLSGQMRVPRRAVLLMLLAVIVLDLGSLAIFNNALDGFTWWATALVFFATLTFFAVNLACMVYFWKFLRNRFRLLKNVVVPVAGMAFSIYLIDEAFFKTLWHGEWLTGKSVVMACLILFAVELLSVAAVQLWYPGILSQGAPIGVELPNE